MSRQERHTTSRKSTASARTFSSLCKTVNKDSFRAVKLLGHGNLGVSVGARWHRGTSQEVQNFPSSNLFRNHRPWTPRTSEDARQGFHFWTKPPGKNGAVGPWGHSDRKTVRPTIPMPADRAPGIRITSSPCGVGGPCSCHLSLLLLSSLPCLHKRRYPELSRINLIGIWEDMPLTISLYFFQSPPYFSAHTFIVLALPVNEQHRGIEHNTRTQPLADP